MGCGLSLLKILTVIILLSLAGGCSKVNVEINPAALSSQAGFSVLDATTTEGGGLQFTIQLDSPQTTSTSVDYVTTNGTALSGSHYTTTSGTAVFAPGETSKVITVGTLANGLEKCAPNRTVNLTLSNPVGAPIIGKSTIGTITDPDLPALSITDATGTEGTAVNFSVSLTTACPTKAVSFRWATSSGTATSGLDFTANNRIATIAPGSTSTTLSVPTLEDTRYEGDETLAVTLSSLVNATSGTLVGTGTISDNDSIPVVTFATSSQTISEAGTTATVTVSLSHPSYQSVTVPYTLSGTAQDGGVDYSIAASPIVIAPGALSGSLTVSLVNDLTSEVAETAILTLGAPTNGSKGTQDSHTLTITDNDYPRITNVTSAMANGTYTSGDVNVSVVFSTSVTVMGTPLLNLNTTPPRFASYLAGSGSTTLTFRYPIQYGDTAADLDYASLSALVLSGGTIKDTVNTTNADLTLPLPGASGSLGNNKNIVINAPTQPQISSVMLSPKVYFKDDAIDLKVTFSENVTVTGTPIVNVSIGGATAVFQYSSGSGSTQLTFQYLVKGTDAGATPSVSSPVDLNGGTIKSSFGVDSLLTFATPTTTGVYVDGRTLTLSFLTPETVVNESSGIGRTAIVSITPAPVYDVTIPLSFTGSAISGVDYTVAQSSVTFPGGQSSVTIDYDVLDDSVDEVGVHFSIIADRPSTRSNILLSELYGTTITILDDDLSKTPIEIDSIRGDDHFCKIDGGGNLYCWGYNTYGQVGDGTTTSRKNPVLIDSGTTYVSVSLGNQQTCGVTSTNVLKCWGMNRADFYLGDGTNIDHHSPVVIDFGTSYSSVKLGRQLICGITVSGALKCWGHNPGNGSLSSVATPVLVDPGVSYVKVSPDYSVACGITTTNVTKCWGNNYSGGLGDGTTTDHYTPQPITSPESFKDVYTFNYAACAISLANELFCWGNNYGGILGVGSTSYAIHTPTHVDSGTTYVSIATNGDAMCGLTTTNKIKCAGYGWYGILGQGTQSEDNLSMAPISSSESYKTIESSFNSFCGTTTSNLRKCWGATASFEHESLTPVLVLASYAFSSIVTDENVSCGITSGGDLYCWGYNYEHALGDGTNKYRWTPIRIDPEVKYKMVTVNYSHSCGITTTNILKCWGVNYNGSVGNGTTDPILQPIVIDGGNTYKEVSAGYDFTCGITMTNELKCWGYNSSSQIGNGTSTDQLSPTVISAGTSFSTVSAGDYHTCAITLLGELKCWGMNLGNRLGDGTAINRSTPVTIDSGVQYSRVVAGYENSCGITTAGTLKCWGSNNSGRLGNGNSIDQTTPAVIDGGTTYKFVDIGTYTNAICAITSSDSLKCWGSNGSLTVGDSNASQVYTSPTVIDGGQTYRSISVGYTTCGITTSNTTKCWGSNLGYNYGMSFGGFFPRTFGEY